MSEQFVSKPWLVIPCYNEAGRLDEEQLVSLTQQMRVLLVDDGSTDSTYSLLTQLQDKSNGLIEVLQLQSNLGKGEAVRLGMLSALSKGATEVGYADADFATPANDLVWLHAALLSDEQLMCVLGSRWARLGAVVERSNARHYLGRVFATLASMMLKLGVYDTQCGAKWFRGSSLLVASLQSGFISRWAFDVELIGRLYNGVGGEYGYEAGAFKELALTTWVDKPGSKIRFFDKLKVLIELVQIAGYLRKLRRHRGTVPE